MEDRGETYDAIRTSLRLLDDPFTRFLDPDRYAALKRGNAGTVTGVGLEVGFSNESGRNRMVVRARDRFPPCRMDLLGTL
jgi:carboxyl-terminal processing protease